MGGHVKHVSPFGSVMRRRPAAAAQQTAAASGQSGTATGEEGRGGEEERRGAERGMPEEDGAPRGKRNPEKKRMECNLGFALTAAINSVLMGRHAPQQRARSSLLCLMPNCAE